MDIDKHNIHAEKLINVEKDHKQKVEDLVKSVKSLEKLRWIRFSRDLDEIKDRYNSLVLDIILQYVNVFKTNTLDENLYSIKTIKFSEFCNNTFDEVYEHFEKINGLE